MSENKTKTAGDTYNNIILPQFKQLIKQKDALSCIQSSENYHHIAYTYLHRQEIFKLGDNLKINARELFAHHDIDKMAAYLFATKKEVHDMHVAMTEHHNRNTTNEKALLEMMFDWESARFTKPDKPLNAYDTLLKYYEHMTPVMLPLLVKYGIDKPTDYSQAITENDFNQKLNAVNPQCILNELCTYAETLN